MFLEDLQYFGQVFDHRVRCSAVIVLSVRKVMPNLDGQSKPRPARAFDSRTSTGDLTVATPVEINASSAPGVAIPADATGVVWNVAAINARQPGFGRVWAADAPQPPTSAFNWSLVGETRAASVIASVDGGRVQVVLDNGSGKPTTVAAGLIADVFGYFT